MLFQRVKRTCLEEDLLLEVEDIAAEVVEVIRVFVHDVVSLIMKVRVMVKVVEEGMQEFARAAD